MTSNTLPNLNDLLPPLSPWARFGSLCVVALLGSTIALANAIPHRSTTQTNAIVAPNRTIQALVSAESIDRIAPHQIAQMRVTACPYGEFGTLKGQVTTIAAQPEIVTDSIPHGGRYANVTQLSQPTLYAVTIQPQTLVLKQATKSCSVRVGMQGKLDIVLREEPLARSLLRRMRLDGSSFH
jgi:multidrug efflux pump subunit AcrA (membrane-fusion protein)